MQDVKTIATLATAKHSFAQQRLFEFQTFEGFMLYIR